MGDYTDVVSEFRRLIDVQVEAFVNASNPLGECLVTLAGMVRRAFVLELDFINTAVRTRQPDDAAFSAMIEPLSAVIREIQEYRDQNRNVAAYFNHLSTISESIVALSWIGVRSAPAQFVRDMRDAGDYFGNRVLSTFRGNEQHTSFINNWSTVLRTLEQYVRAYHTTGFAWGVLIVTGTGCGDAGPNLPPPPPPPPAFQGIDHSSGDTASRQALLFEINQGVDIVRMLRPVNRGHQAAHPAAPPAAGPSVPPRPKAVERSYPPKLELEGRKWRVEHQRDDYSLMIDNADMSQSLAMFKCEKIGLEVKNKVNAVTIDNVKKSTIVLNDIISSVDLIRCADVKLYCYGTVPLISLDSCDCIQIFLTDRSVNAEIISSKSSSSNICLLAPDGDYEEFPMPEQIKNIIVGKKVQSSVIEKV